MMDYYYYSNVYRFSEINSFVFETHATKKSIQKINILNKLKALKNKQNYV